MLWSFARTPEKPLRPSGDARPIRKNCADVGAYRLQSARDPAAGALARRSWKARAGGPTGWLDLSASAVGRLLGSDDALDTPLNGRAPNLGRALRPDKCEQREAAGEGWIAVPAEGSHERLANA